MSKPFDAATKRMVALDPSAWLRLLGPLPPGVSPAQVEVLDVDLSTVTAAADCILRVSHRSDLPLHHIEFETSPKDWLPLRSALYNTLIRYRTGQSVRTTLFLLRPETRTRRFTGVYADTDEAGEEWFRFRYDVIRLYEADPEPFLAGPLAVLPLATVCRVSRSRFAQVVKQMESRLLAEAPDTLGRELYTASYVLAGLNHPQGLVNQIMKGLPQMRESSTYRHILEEGLREGREKGMEEGRATGIEEGRVEGRVEEARNLLVLAGNRRLGNPDEPTRQTLANITSTERLEALVLRLFEVETWAELLSAPE